MASKALSNNPCRLSLHERAFFRGRCHLPPLQSVEKHGIGFQPVGMTGWKPIPQGREAGNSLRQNSYESATGQYPRGRTRPCTRSGSPIIRRNPSASVWL